LLAATFGALGASLAELGFVKKRGKLELGTAPLHLQSSIVWGVNERATVLHPF